MKQIYGDKNSYATDPGKLYMSERKLKRVFFRDLFTITEKIKRLLGKEEFHKEVIRRMKEHMYFGDCQPAVVVSVEPLYIAAYSSDIDCVILLKGIKYFTDLYKLKVGSRLLSVNTYGIHKDDDIEHGPYSRHMWNACWPIIAEFVSNNFIRIKKRKLDIEEERWERAYELGCKKLSEKNFKYRSCNPWASQFPKEKALQYYK